MCHISLAEALVIADHRIGASNQELQDAHRAIDVRCAETDGGLAGRLEGLVSLKGAKVLKLRLADEMAFRGIQHKPPRPARRPGEKE